MAVKQYTIDEIAKLLGQNVSLQNNGFNGSTTAFDQYRNADNMLNYLDSLEDIHDESSAEKYNNFANQFNAEKSNAVFNGVLAGVSGASSIISNAVRDSQINDTSMWENQIADRRNYGNLNYNSYDQITNDIANRRNIEQPTLEQIGKMSTGQQIGSVASSALSGATAGMQIGGPWGAAIGGAIGIAGGLLGVGANKRNAEARQAYLASSTAQANAISDLNLAAAHERIGDRENRYKMVRAVARGGRIERKRESIDDFAHRVMRAPGNRMLSRPGDMVRTYEDGGVRIKIRKR